MLVKKAQWGVFYDFKAEPVFWMFRIRDLSCYTAQRYNMIKVGCIGYFAFPL